MSKFLQDEKPKQADFKAKGPYFSEAARVEGLYKNHPYPFCLPREYADENLFSEIRQLIIAYFARNKIKWHDGQDGKPSNHLCDSQVSCANFRLAIETGIAFQIHYEIEDVLLPPLEAMLSHYPEAKVIWCHLGQVRYRERASHYSNEHVRGLIAHFPNLYFDLGLPGPPHVHPATGQRDQMIYVHNGLPPCPVALKTPVYQNCHLNNCASQGSFHMSTKGSFGVSGEAPLAEITGGLPRAISGCD